MTLGRTPGAFPLALVLGLGALAVAPIACDRAAKDRSAATTATLASDDKPSPAPTSAPLPAAPAPNRCVVPLASSPPRTERPAATCPKDPDGLPTLPHGLVSFPEAPGQPHVTVEAATTPDSQERGLMYRTSLPDDQGMIFTWTTEAERSFWMRNTCIPLDMIYIAADGTIVGVLEQVPAMDETPRGVPCPVSHVLEVNAGFTRAHGILPGQHAHIDT